MDAVKNFLDYLSSDRGYSPETILNYGADLEKFGKFLRSIGEATDWRNVDRDMVRQWVASMVEDGARPTSVKRRLSSLRSFYHFLMQTGMATHDPANGLRGPKAQKTLPSYLREGEVNRLIDDIDFGADFNGVRDRLIVLTFYTTGLRLSELVNMDLSQVDLDRGQLRVFGKRRKERIVPFGDELAENLHSYIYNVRAHVAPDTQPALFVSKQGLRMTRVSVASMVRKRLALVTTMKKKSPHVLRHTFATALLNNGADLESVKELLGHDSLSTTAIYAHTTFAELEKEYKHAHPRA